MALSKERKLELARMTLPSDAETVKRAISFRTRTGLTVGEFSVAIGYAESSLHVYLNGRYGDNLTERPDSASTANTRAIRHALKQFMDLHEGAMVGLQQRPAHPTEDFKAVRRACLNALERGSAYLIDGPPGTQKTFSLRAIEREINNREDGTRAVYVYARIDHSPQAFLQEICNTAGISSRGMIDQLIRKLRFFLATGRVLLIIDEAQHLDHKGLEVLRQLLDLPPHFGVILSGSHDLTQRLSHWQMEQWRSRVRKTLYLDGPSIAEARAILRAELEPLLGAHSDAQCDGVIDGCFATASRMQKAGGKLTPRSFQYISARDLFFTIEGIQQSLQQNNSPAQRQPGSQPASQKESAA
jgi:type II secretory pathway predicted ATPase ExeA